MSPACYKFGGSEHEAYIFVRALQMPFNLNLEPLALLLFAEYLSGRRAGTSASAAVDLL